MASNETLEYRLDGAVSEGPEHESQVERAYWTLRTAISRLELRPNEQLSEVSLARRYGFGRTPVREAVHRLRQDGLVVSVPRRGLFVSSFTVDDIREVYEFLEGLDGIAAYLAAEQAQAEELTALEELHRQMVADLERGDLPAWQEHNFSFHRQFVAMARNERIVQTFDLLHDQLRRALLLTLPLRGNQTQTMAEHAAFIQAFRKRDAERARSLAQQHRRRIRGIVLQTLSSIPLPGLRY